MVETQYRDGTTEQRERFVTAAHELLKDRNLSRALTGFDRLDGEVATMTNNHQSNNDDT